MKIATVRHTKIYMECIIVSHYFKLFPEKKHLKGPFVFLGKPLILPESKQKS